MKKVTLFFMAIFSALLFGQNIESVKKIVQEINKTKNFTTKVVPYAYFLDKSEMADHGMELKGFYKNGRIRKMEYFVGLSLWNIITEYFFSKDGTLVFVHSKKYLTQDENEALEKPQMVSQLRKYYDNETLIKNSWIQQ